MNMSEKASYGSLYLFQVRTKQLVFSILLAYDSNIQYILIFADNQEVLDLIDRKHTGILALLDEQCIVPRSDDQKFTRYLYAKCDTHNRFSASAAQRVDYKFSIDHYAGPVEYSTDNWLEKNKDQMPSASVDLLKEAKFELLGQLQVSSIQTLILPSNLARFTAKPYSFFSSVDRNTFAPKIGMDVALLPLNRLVHSFQVNSVNFAHVSIQQSLIISVA